MLRNSVIYLLIIIFLAPLPNLTTDDIDSALAPPMSQQCPSRTCKYISLNFSLTYGTALLIVYGKWPRPTI